MTTLPPFIHLAATHLATIREQADIAEKLCKLNAEELIIVHKEQWFKMLAPACYGGLQLPLPQVVQFEEELARADGSLGWAITLCAGAGWFGGFTDPVFSEQIFKNKLVCLAGSGAPTGFADVVPGGYNVTGKWLHATGALHATVFTANCIIRENDEVLTDDAGKEKVLSFTFLKEEVAVIPGWPFMGMKGTSSYQYMVNDVVVPPNRTFIIDAKAAVIDAPLYKYPFTQLAWATLAANISGMALHFVELAEQIFKQKTGRQGVLLMEMDVVKNAFYIYLQQLLFARSTFFDALNRSWELCDGIKPIDNAVLDAVSRTAYLLSETAKRTVDNLYPYCGLAAADTSSEINRVWRDIHTAGQHSLLVFGNGK